MRCLSDGVLRARIDGEMDKAELQEVDGHLATCAACRQRAEALTRDAAWVHDVLATLAPVDREAPASARLALARLKTQIAPPSSAGTPQASRWGWFFSRRLAPAWAAIAFALLVAASLSFAPARSWAQRVLAMLRVEKITVLPIDAEGIQRSLGGSQLKNICRLLSDDIVVTLKPGEPQTASDGETASQLAGFKVRLLASRSDAPRIRVEGEAAFHMTLRRDRLQSVLDELGRPDLQLPPSIDGAIVAVHVPKIVTIRYGDCSNGVTVQYGEGTSRADALSEVRAPGAGNCTNLLELPSPTVSVPPELDMQQLAEMGLELAGMSPQEAQIFSQNVDWTSTLVLGIPRGTSYQTVQVDGVQGTMIELPRRPPKYLLLWVKNGIIHSLNAEGNSSDAVLLTESLK